MSFDQISGIVYGLALVGFLLSVYGGGAGGAELHDGQAVQRAELGERLAQWLTEHGNGTRVRHT